MATEKYGRAVAFLAKHLRQMTYDGGGGTALDFPDFELMAFDYLEFAERELVQGGAAASIHCVGHLKRAIECEIDTLIGVLGLGGKISNFPKKMDFAASAGIISLRSLVRLNKLRNVMEHEYSIPETSNLEIYFDLATGFVHAIEGYLYIVAGRQEMDWVHKQDELKTSLRMKLVPGLQSIQMDMTENGIESGVTFDAKQSIEEYLEGLKMFFLISRADRLLSADYVIAKLQGVPYIK